MKMRSFEGASLFALVLLAMTTACSQVQVDAWSGQKLSDRPEVRAFQQTLYVVTRKHCISCHNTDVAPHHAAEDPNVAHDELLEGQKVDFDHPEKSRIYLKVREGHNCWDGNCDAASAAILAAIKEWKTLRGGGSSANTDDPVIFSKEMPVQADLPDANRDNNNDTGLRDPALTFDVSTLFTPILPGATIEIHIAKWSDTTYRISRVRMKADRQATVYMKGLNILINGDNSPQRATFRYIDQSFDIGTNFSDISTAAGITPFDRGPGLDKIQLGFQALNEGTGANIGQQRFLAAKAIFRQYCIACHSGVAGRPDFNNSTAPLDSEQDFRNFMWNGQPLVVKGDMNSLLIQVIMTKMPTNRDQNFRNNVILPPIRDWILNMQ